MVAFLSSGGSLVPGPHRVPPPGPTSAWDAEGGIYQQMSLVEHWERRRPPQAVPNTSWGPGDLLTAQGAHTNTQAKRPEAPRIFFSSFFIYCLVRNIWEREFSDCPENEAAVSSSETFLWLFWGRKGLQESRFSLHFCSAFLAVKAKLTLRERVMCEQCPVQIPLHFHLIAKRSLSSRKWHVLKDLSTYNLK